MSTNGIPATIAETIVRSMDALGRLIVDVSANIMPGSVDVQCGYGLVDDDRIVLVDRCAALIGGDWQDEARMYLDSQGVAVGSYKRERTIDGVHWRVWCPLAKVHSVLDQQARITRERAA